MRLIDAEELLKNYTNSFVSAYGVECAEMFRGVINQSKTACDIDKVVNEAEARGYNKAINECLELVEFYINQYDGIYWLEREIKEKLKEGALENE